MPEELLDLRDTKTRLSYSHGENIFKQGAFSPYVIYIVEGIARVYLETGSKKHINLRIARSGEFLGLPAVFGENHYLTSAIALTDTLVCMIDKDSFGRLLKENTSFAMQIMSHNLSSERRLINIISSLNYNQMRGKLASTLIYLSSDNFAGEGVFKLLSRQDIADFASISLESTVKFLKEFNKEGIISLDGREINITDHEKLISISLSSYSQ